MSRSEAEKFFHHLDANPELKSKLSEAPAIDAVIEFAINQGFEISDVY